MIPKQTQEKLNTLASVYSQEIFNSASNAIKKYSRSGATLDSLKVTWLKSTDKEPPRIILIFELQAALFEVRKMSWVRLPKIDNLEAWAESVNLDGPVPGYKNGVAPNLPPWKAKLRKLWAIAKDKRTNDTWKRKPWRKVALSDVLKQLNKATLEAWEKDVEDILTESLQTGTVLTS
jgi:hypothetical protein